MARTEARIKSLKDRARARRQTKPIAGSTVKFEIAQSSTYSISIPAGQRATKRIKFTPSNNSGGVFVSLSVQSPWPKLYSYQEPQTTNGSVIVQINADGSMAENHTTTFSVVASGTVTGTFSEV